MVEDLLINRLENVFVVLRIHLAGGGEAGLGLVPRTVVALEVLVQRLRHHHLVEVLARVLVRVLEVVDPLVVVRLFRQVNVRLLVRFQELFLVCFVDFRGETVGLDRLFAPEAAVVPLDFLEVVFDHFVDELVVLVFLLKQLLNHLLNDVFLAAPVFGVGLRLELLVEQSRVGRHVSALRGVDVQVVDQHRLETVAFDQVVGLPNAILIFGCSRGQLRAEIN